MTPEEREELKRRLPDWISEELKEDLVMEMHFDQVAKEIAVRYWQSKLDESILGRDMK